MVKIYYSQIKLRTTRSRLAFKNNCINGIVLP
jgi:hypothetical protein